MSANWSCCPKCLAKAKVERASNIAEANDLYGKVPMEEFLAAKNKAEVGCVTNNKLREDFIIGVRYDGLFSVGYRGECKEPGCSFVFTFEKEIPSVLEIVDEKSI